MNIIAADSYLDRVSAAVQTVLALPPDEFDFFMQNVLRRPEEQLGAFYQSDPSGNRQAPMRVGIDEFMPLEQRCRKLGGTSVSTLTFLQQLKTQAHNKATRERWQQLDERLNYWDLFVAYYSRTAQVEPKYATRLLMLLENPSQLRYLLTSAKDPELTKHVAQVCDDRVPNEKVLREILGAERMTALRKTYVELQKQGVNFDQYINPFYHFEIIRDSQGNAAMFAHPYQDDADFEINPQLLQQLDLAACHETTPEAQAVWVYTKLCNVLQYDEGYFYSQRRGHPNDDPFASFDLVERVTADTPTTCFNFSRIAVKLLNQIKGVHATIIAEGSNRGHFRFGFYTDRVSVDAEAVSDIDGFSDMARVKLGIPPVGLRAIYGAELVQKLITQTAEPLLQANKQGLHEYRRILQKIPAAAEPVQIDIKELLAEFRAGGIDGSSAVQVLMDMNRQFAQRPYLLARVGKVVENEVFPELLVRGDNGLLQIDLNDLTATPLSGQELGDAIRNATMIPVGAEHINKGRRMAAMLNTFTDDGHGKDDTGGKER